MKDAKTHANHSYLKVEWSVSVLIRWPAVWLTRWPHSR